MDVVFEIIHTIFEVLSNIVRYFAGATIEANLQPDPVVVGAILLVITILIGSACWAGAVAEMRRHPMKRHFVLGFLFPGVYPLLIIFAMDVKGAKERERAWREKQEKEAEERRRAAALAEEAAPEEAVKTRFDQAYFKDIAFDKDGNPTGSWFITFGEVETNVQRIVEALPAAVVVQMQAEDGTAQTIRIPYAKITDCKRADAAASPA